MLTGKAGTKGKNICDLSYLTEIMGGKRQLILGIMEDFLKQVPDELTTINEAIRTKDFAKIRSFAHTMKSSVSIMGISVLTPVLKEMEDLGRESENIERIKELGVALSLLVNQALLEMEGEKHNYA